MIDRNSPIYHEAKWRVKIGHAFLEKGIDIKGVVHVGANDGYEVQWYLQLGIENIMCFEPYSEPAKRFREHYQNDIASGKVKFYEIGLGDKQETKDLYLGPADGQNSSFLQPTEDFKDQPNFKDILNAVNGKQSSTTIMRFDKFIDSRLEKIDLSLYDCLTVDVQGMELNVLKGFGKYLDNFKYLNIECSEVPVYEGSASAQEIIDFLKRNGFRQDSPIEPHNDIFFIRENL